MRATTSQAATTATDDDTLPTAAEFASAEAEHKEHQFLERLAQMRHQSYAANVAEIARQLRALADDVERYGMDLQYATEQGPNYLRATSRAISAATSNQPRVATLVERAAEAQQARADLAAWEAAH